MATGFPTTVKSFKADFSSVSLSSELRANTCQSKGLTLETLASRLLTVVSLRFSLTQLMIPNDLVKTLPPTQHYSFLRKLTPFIHQPNFVTFQDQVPKEQLVKSLHQEFVTVVNEVGVDPNRLLEHPHTVSLLQFVCGLGPRKASSLLKVILTIGKRF